MPKLSLAIFMAVVLALFAGADFYLNGFQVPGRQDLVAASEPVPAKEAIKMAAPVVSRFRLGQEINGYQVDNQQTIRQLFEKIDLSQLADLRLNRNTLLVPPAEGGAGPKTIYLYEAAGPAGQGSLTYLNVKLQFLAQLDPAAETLNETSEFGQNSFFLNNSHYPNTAFLLTQIGDGLYGFQYNKQDSAIYSDVQAIVQGLQSDNS